MSFISVPAHAKLSLPSRRDYQQPISKLAILGRRHAIAGLAAVIASAGPGHREHRPSDRASILYSCVSSLDKGLYFNRVAEES